MSTLKIFFKGLKNGFRNFFHKINEITNFIFLFAVYFIGIGSVSIFSKIFGRNYLDLKSHGSSWVVRKMKKKPIEDYYRSF